MRRVIVLGGLGLFGRTIAEQLRAARIPTLVASRRVAADLQVDAEDAASIRAALGEGDVVVDAAGPFQARSTVLLEAAIDRGFDLIDINDHLAYAQQVLALQERIDAAGIRVLSSASSVSAVAAAIVRRSEVSQTVRVSGFLVPATRHTANPGSARSLIRSVGRPVSIWRDGRLQTALGWAEDRRFPMPRPIGMVRGRLFETADAVYLPRIWPSLREVAMYVDTNTPGLNTLLRIAARLPPLRSVLQSQVRLGTWLSRRFGSERGGLGYEIEDASGQVRRIAVVSGSNGYLAAIAPAVLAVRALVEGRFTENGLVLPDRHVEPSRLIHFLEAAGMETVEIQ